MGRAKTNPKGLGYCIVESKVQKRLVRFLKSKGCYVIKTKPGPGTPVGCPDVLALYEGFWAAFEVKADSSSPFQPLQEATISKFEGWSFARVVHSENIDEVIGALELIL